MENLAGDLLFGLKLVKLSILPMLFIQIVQDSLGELISGYLGFKGVTPGDADFGFLLLHNPLMELSLFNSPAAPYVTMETETRDGTVWL